MKINQDQHNFILIVAIVKMDIKPSMDNNLWIIFFKSVTKGKDKISNNMLPKLLNLISILFFN